MTSIEKKRKQRLKWYHEHPERSNATLVRWRERNKFAAINVLTDGEGTCRWCGQGDIDVLCIDHVDNDGAEHRKKIGHSAVGWWLTKNGYPPGFQVLCYNCNAKKQLLHLRSQSFGGA